MDAWEHKLETEVTVQYPSGREKDGVVAKRYRMRLGEPIVNRYAVLFDDDSADPEVPPQWIRPRRQKSLLV